MPETDRAEALRLLRRDSFETKKGDVGFHVRDFVWSRSESRAPQCHLFKRAAGESKEMKRVMHIDCSNFAVLVRSYQHIGIGGSWSRYLAKPKHPAPFLQFSMCTVP
jgi:hypothetical protein